MKKVFVKTLIVAFTLTANLFWAFRGVEADYSSTNSGVVGGVTVNVKNNISSDFKHGYANTVPSGTNYQYVDSSVSATFYYIDRKNDIPGEYPLYQNTYGIASVTAPTLSGNQLYYKVISTHTATYGGGTLSFPNMTTYAP